MVKDRLGLFLQRFVQGCAKRAIALSFVTVATLLLVGAIFFNRATVNTVFEVTGRSEIVSGILVIDPRDPSTHLLWALSRGTICAGSALPRRPGTALQSACDRTLEAEIENGDLLEISTPLEFVIERIAGEELRIDLIAPDGAQAEIAAIYSEESAAQRTVLPSPLSLVIPIEETSAPVSMPFVARRIKLGREITIRGVGPQPLLREGLVQILSRNVIGDRIFIARTVPIRLGDVVEGESETSEDLISAVIRAGSGDALDAIFRLNAKELRISGLFTEPRIERLNRLDQIRNDSLLAALWSVVGLLVAAMGISFFIGRGREDEL